MYELHAQLFVDDPVLQSHPEYRAVRENPGPFFGVPEAAGGLDLLAKFCFPVADRDGEALVGRDGYAGHPVLLVDYQFHGLVPLAPGLVVAVTDADQLVAVGFEEFTGPFLAGAQGGADGCLAQGMGWFRW